MSYCISSKTKNIYYIRFIFLKQNRDFRGIHISCIQYHISMWFSGFDVHFCRYLCSILLYGCLPWGVSLCLYHMLIADLFLIANFFLVWKKNAFLLPSRYDEIWRLLLATHIKFETTIRKKVFQSNILYPTPINNSTLR